MSRLSEIGERGVVAALIKKFDPDGLFRLGDDTAILDYGKEQLLITTDTITQRTHIPDNALPEDIGWYVAAINLSDIAAMGGSPLGMLFSLGLPPSITEEWLDKLTDGIQDCSSRFKAPVIGGDTKENSNITITGIAIGTVPKDQIMRRSGARPGDIVAVTGSLGRGLLWERDRRNNLSQYLRIEPKLELGKKLAESGAVTSCIDISDGLSTSLHLLRNEGQVGFDINYSDIPIKNELNDNERELALHYGGDYELLFTLRPDKAESVLQPGMSQIGYVTDEETIWLARDGGREELPDRGYEHFRGEP